jgi:methylthioribose-1-phosphate isomerase
LYQAVREGKDITVFVDETRPLLQGARLTAWELKQAGLKVVLMCDNASGDAMRRGKIDMAIVGADRVAANGDTANKIGTYSLAVLAAAHGIPLWIACPRSTIDLALESGDQIPIEMRSGEEVRMFAGVCCAPADVDTYNPAFDVTPHRYISGFITEAGLCRPPFRQTLPEMCETSVHKGRLPSE